MTNARVTGSLKLLVAALLYAPIARVEAAGSSHQTYAETVGKSKVTLRFNHAPCERDAVIETPLYVEISGKRKQTFTLKPDGEPAACSGLTHLIQQDDFNFDGYPDFAVALDFTGGRGGPSYRVFIFQPRTGTFVQAPALSELTHESIGLFEVDHEKKRLIVSSKSTCCVEVRGEYSVQGLKPIEELVEVSTYTSDADYCLLEVERTVRGQPTEVTRNSCPADAN